MRLVISLLAAVLLLIPAAAGAQSFVQPAPSPAAPITVPAPAPVTELAATAPAAEEKVQESARAEQTLARDARDDRQFAQRGSFWWLVGVIVIAGVLLAVLLD